MKGVVLAAGAGTRLRSLADDTPKALVTVDGCPLVSYGLDDLVDLGVDELVVVGYLEAQVMAYVGEAYRGVPVTYVHQRDRLGLAHALWQAARHIQDDFVLLLGDNVFDAVLDRHRSGAADATLLVEEVPRKQASRYGVCRLDDEGNVVGLVEKPADPPSTLVLTGFYAFSPAIVHACRLVRPPRGGSTSCPTRPTSSPTPAGPSCRSH